VSTHPLVKKITCLSVSLFVTAVWFSFDTNRTESHQVESLLHWSRQITQQTESLSLYAREKNEQDPISWAVKYLMVGDETRPLWIKPYYESQGNTHTENFTFNSSKGDFYYSKILNPETGQGIQLKIHSEPIGFLGTNSIWTNDAVLLITFLLIYGSAMAITSGKVNSPSGETLPLSEPADVSNDAPMDKTQEPDATPIPAPVAPAPSSAADPSDWKAPILIWIQDAKKVLMNLGLSIKTMTQEAKNLAEVVSKSRNSLTLSLDTVGILKKTVEDLELIVLQPADNIDHLREVTATLKDLGEKTSNQIDAVLNEYHSAFEVAQKLNESITLTNQGILQEAKLFQTLKAKI